MLGKMKELMDLKKKADQIKKELDAETIEVNEVSGIRIVINGTQSFKYLEVDDELLKPENKGKLEKSLLKAINSGITKSQQAAAKKMSAVMPGLPGM